MKMTASWCCRRALPILVICIIFSRGAYCQVNGTVWAAVADLGTVAAVRSCVPFTVLIQGSDASNTTSGNSSTIDFTADESVINATAIYFLSGILTIQITDGFETSQPINLTITVPSSGLDYVQNLGSGVVILSNITTSNLSITAAGTGGINGQGLSADDLSITSAGMGVISMNGTFGAVSVKNQGISEITVYGAISGPVHVNVGGITTTWLQTTPDASITGVADGLAKVLYTAGTCDVDPRFTSMSGDSIFGPSCENVDSESSPSPVVPSWTCGIRVSGTTNCAVGSGLPPTVNFTSMTPLEINSSTISSSIPATDIPTSNSTNTPGTSTSTSTSSGTDGKTNTAIASGPGTSTATSTSTSGPGAFSSSTATSSGTMGTVDPLDLSLPSSSSTSSSVSIQCGVPYPIPVL